MKSLRFVPVVVLSFVQWTWAANPLSFPMHQIAYWMVQNGPTYACGDADRDGRPELYALKHDSVGQWVGHVFEHAGSNRFDTIPIHDVSKYFYQVGDGDADGRVEVLTCSGGIVRLYEARDSTSLPDTMVWTDTLAGSAGFAFPLFSDLDSDSLVEVVDIYEVPDVCRVLENRGDNRYDLVAEIGPVRSPYCTAVSADADRDGKPELVLGHEGTVALYEASGDDEYERVAGCQLAPNTPVGAVCFGPDIDDDGLPEILATGVGSDGGYLGVYEAPSNDSLVQVALVRFVASAADFAIEKSIAVGDMNGDSVEEVAVGAGSHALLFQCYGNDSFGQVWSTRTHGSYSATLFDINSDGRCELIHGYRYQWTIIWAYGDSAGMAEGRLRTVGRVSVTPSVTRGAPVRVAGMADGTEVEVVDAAGRVVAKPRDGVWNPRGVSPGAYFVRVRSGNQAVVRKVLVLR